MSTKQNCKTVKFEVGDIPAGTSVTKEHKIKFSGDVRGYWQVYFTFNGSSWHIDKNNAQANAWSQDNGTIPEITVRKEVDKLRLDFVFNSGNAYFYATVLDCS